MRKLEKKNNFIISIISNHIYNNLKQYIIVSVLLVIGIVIGVMVVNNTKIDMKEEIKTVITTFIECLKTEYQIDSMNLLKNIIGNHIIFAFLLWFLGCTVIGIPIVYILITYKGFSLGYTISMVIYTLGTGKGILFNLITMFLQNLLIIPAILALAVSGMKLYSSIMKDKRRENIKIEIIRHTVFSFFMLLILILSALIDVYISNSLLNMCIQYF